MKLVRIFSTDSVKGTKGYLKSQRKYELFRTLLYFAISLSLFIAGWVTTKNRINLLTVVAILGCLPASKSAVITIMFFRFKGCAPADSEQIEKHSEGLTNLYDMIFTTSSKSHIVDHLAVKGKTICGYTTDAKFDEQAFLKHIDGILKADQLTDCTIKVFRDLPKYLNRLDTLREVSTEEQLTPAIASTLKSVCL